MSLTDKRKASSATAGPSTTPASSSSKRVRIDEPSRRQRKREETDFFDGDPELEEEERRRIRRDQKSGRIDDRGEDLSESDESDANGADLFNENEDESDAEADAGSHRRRAEKKRRGDAAGAGGDDDDEDMFDVADDEPKASKSGKGKQKDAKRGDHLNLGELGEGQDFGSKTRSAVDAADDDAEALRGGDADDDDLDPDLELEDEDERDDDDRDVGDPDRDQYVDLNALAERSPPTSPGGTPLSTSSRTLKAKKSNKSKAPKVTGFNMKEEMRTGKFDAEGNYHENQRDPDAQHDVWLTGNYSKIKILEARKAQQKRDQEARDKEKAALQVDGDEDDVKKRLVEFMHRAETVQRTLQRLGRVLADRKKAAKSKGSDGTDEVKQAASDVDNVTHLSSVLMSRFGRLDIYDQTYERLLHDVHKSGLVRQTFDPAAKYDPAPVAAEANAASSSSELNATAGDWEYRWTPSYLAAAAREAGTPVDPEIQVFGPFGLAELKNWAQQGYFGDGGERILLRRKGSKDAWTTYNDVASADT
ncbi:hypothetical protein PSEUBRA_001100 [Kalmanozyma brasiliensis GHG001]|uniref:GYF domain-containing protein n=1 Tax=Kalmanozyma brasiliensis (strain GHG001) TaxID=1365824 RepID=V5GTC1_KALBG|nr:uncharacterized protein PSEUBRA_001100 [Kalmanozyma brasiliensis GHG001]EST09152.1 hypothetical protein PSEUBRA_001100 [Kalmanozyma brasiliensis GHG001]